MKTQQLSNAARAMILVIAIIILSIVSAKADMITATYSPYKCTLEIKNDNKDNFNNTDKKSRSIYYFLTDVNMRKFNFKNIPEERNLNEEVRRYDVTSQRHRLIVAIKVPECELPIYKII